MGDYLNHPMKLYTYNEQTEEVAAYMEEGDAPAMSNEAVTYHEVLRAP